MLLLKIDIEFGPDDLLDSKTPSVKHLLTQAP